MVSPQLGVCVDIFLDIIGMSSQNFNPNIEPRDAGNLKILGYNCSLCPVLAIPLLNDEQELQNGEITLVISQPPCSNPAPFCAAANKALC